MCTITGLAASDCARSARLFPVGCTAWLINDAQQCFLTAGHCFTGDVNQVAQFNVPLSDESGNVNHPGPEDQYFMDGSSLQFKKYSMYSHHHGHLNNNSPMCLKYDYK